MAQSLTVVVPGNLGNVAGAESDGVLIGAVVPQDLSAFLLESLTLPALCMTEFSNLYTDETADFGEATADDVALTAATPAQDDSVYFGHASTQFEQVDIEISTQGDPDSTIVWEYWDGAQWSALANVTDGTSEFTAATGTRSVTFDLPGDWVKNTVDNVLAFWVRARMSDFTSQTTATLATQGNVVTSNGQFTDDTVEASDAGAGDVELLPATPTVGDAAYFGHAEKFCKLKIEVSQELIGTQTITWKYWDGDSWENLTTFDDDTQGFTATAGTHLLHFVPPADWTANTAGNGPNGEAGFFVKAEITALTSITQQPQATQIWVHPLGLGASGVPVPAAGTLSKITGNALTKSASNNDSIFLVVNKTQKTFAQLTWTQATAYVLATVALSVSVGNELLLVQITEDGTTELANANFVLSL